MAEGATAKFSMWEFAVPIFPDAVQHLKGDFKEVVFETEDWIQVAGGRIQVPFICEYTVRAIGFTWKENRIS
jgi:hypothetical protein